MPRRFLFLFGALLFVFGNIFLFSKVSAQPGMPVNFNGVSNSACSVQLNWNQPDPAYYFIYQHSTRGDFQTFNEIRYPQTGYLPGAPTSGNFNNTSAGLRSNTNYWFRIQSCDTGACSGYVTIGPVGTASLPSAPGAPINVAASVLPGGAGLQDIILTWGTSTPISIYGGYSIWESVNGGSYSYAGYLPANPPNRPLEYRLNGRNLNSTYSYYVESYESDLNCEIHPNLTPSQTNQIVFSGQSNVAVVPLMPGSFAANYTGGIANLIWVDNSTNENNFELWKATNQTFTQGRQIFTIAANEEIFHDQNLLPNTTYYYKIRSCAGTPSSCSLFSNIQSISTGLAATTLNANIARSSFLPDPGVATVYLYWGSVGGVNTYEIHRSTDPTFAIFSVRGSVAGSAEPEFYDQGVPLNQVYYYRLKAIGSSVNFSNSVNVDLNLQMIMKGSAFANINSRGIGWINFNSDTGTGGVVKYSVQVDRDGAMSGAAWASKYGWLSFNKTDLLGCPSGTCEARFTSSTNQVSGWARFISPQIFPGMSNWTGWLKLRGSIVVAGMTKSSVASDFRNNIRNNLANLLNINIFEKLSGILQNSYAQNSFGINFDSSTKNFTNVGWGGDIAGWLAFGAPECSLCTVSADLANIPPEQGNQPPVVSNVLIEAGPTGELWCAEAPFYRVRWTYSDPENNPQRAAEIEFFSGSTVLFSATSTGPDITYRLTDPISELGANQSFNARVRVSDGNLWSPWVASAQGETTPSHYLPLVNFHWQPDPTVLFASTTFINDTQNRSGGSYPITSYLWEFSNASPSTANTPNAEAVFSQLPSDTTLTVSDSSGSCILIKTINGGGGHGRRIIRER